MVLTRFFALFCQAPALARQTAPPEFDVGLAVGSWQDSGDSSATKRVRSGIASAEHAMRLRAAFRDRFTLPRMSISMMGIHTSDFGIVSVPEGGVGSISVNSGGFYGK
ncbi:hypothetical protein C2L64_20220 [Paraburkholderia hospita]|uniref:Uncharacterized protein n=1 Tax=Paraburkholderia hospita TaxID=169430 RepID=A0AAN1JBM8_9BURK|nr:hypothetical protein C2L64_20220 [Paraburkholderia hospita]OUL69490.1 hypothetical protein CA601_49065 [Paraburkholderia hospita]OUL90949.1 hypothetical protein CA602_06060 [Paraburkholderia hospita]